MSAPQAYQDVIAGFLRQISQADERASALRTANGGHAAPGDGTVQPVFQELEFALEELHTAEEELRAQNEELIAAHERVDLERRRYLDLFRDAPVAYLVTDMSGVIQDSNRAACDLLHRPEKFLRGKPIAIFAPESERRALRDVISDLNQLESTRQRLEIILSPSTGRPFTAEIIASRVPAGAGGSSTIRWALVDRVEREERGTVDRAVARTLQESSEEVIITVDRDQRVTWWNRAAELAFGYSSTEVLGKPSPVRLPEHFEGVEVFERKDGRKIRLDVSCLLLPATAADGYMFRMRRVRSDRRQHPETTGQQVLARLAGGVAHHLNNAMQIMVSGLEFAHRDLADRGQLANDLQTVTDAAFRAVEFTRALVSYTGQDLPSPATAVNLNSLVESTLADVSAELPSTVQFSTFLDRSIPEVLADPVVISRVVRELLLNGARSVETGGRILVETIDVSARHMSLRHEPGPPNGYVRLSIHDSGIGMTEETREHFFEPFFANRPVGTPVGLGLSAAWGVVMHSGGFIRIESKPGSGSSLHMYLPKPGPGAVVDPPIRETPV